jgi:preprotein translocase subunit SecE
MNAKVEKKSQSQTSAADILKFIVAVLLLAAGVFGFYWFSAWATPLRGLLVAFGLVAALVVFALTALGRRALEFFAEARFELRKVVWPTRQESFRTTGVIIVVIMIMSLILAAIDMVLGFGVGKLLG